MYLALFDFNDMLQSLVLSVYAFAVAAYLTLGLVLLDLFAGRIFRQDLSFFDLVFD